MGDVTDTYSPYFSSKLLCAGWKLFALLRFIIEFIQHLLQAGAGIEIRNLK